MFPRRRGRFRYYAHNVYGRRRRVNSWMRDSPWLPTVSPSSINIVSTATSKPETTKPKEEIPPVPETELATKLHVTGVDLHIADNTKTHNTDMYECTQDRVSGGTNKKAQLVLRRGQEFTMTIQFERAFDIKKNDITFDFTLGGEDEDKQKVIKSFRLEESEAAPYKPRKWGANLVKKKEKSLTVSVFIPASSPVGEWELSVSNVVDVKEGEDIVWKYNHDEEVIVLFNPWCKEDLVYMADKDWLKEAVLNDSGCVYRGFSMYIQPRPWYFGQFEDQVLEASLHLLRKAFKFDASPALGSVVRVTRALSKIVNSMDDAGVLVGNWSGYYSGGTSPSTWVGSVKILKQYMTTTKPVKYGQCWVYSCVLTTVCRALGIPCRSVTNFESAHNTDKEHLSCDTYNYKLPNGEMEEEKIDSVWNFHVWNEAWMSRPDLTDSEGRGLVYDGWQVIDATPQEESDGSYQCGPCPVVAVKEGHVNVGLDTAFVFAEVNGDKVEWLVDQKKKTFIQLSRDRNAVGKCISTHVPTGEPYNEDEKEAERLDITREYKYEEGSKEERAAVRRAERTFRLANFDGEEGEEPTPIEAIELTLDATEDTVFLGSEFEFKLTVRNTGAMARTVNVSMKANNTDYTGETLATVAEEKIADTVMNVGDVKMIKVKVDTMLDLDKPNRGSTYECKAVANVKESENTLKTSKCIYVRNPPLEITGPKECKKEGQVTVKVSFNNTLRKPLTNCKLGVEGNMKCLDESQQEMTIGDIGAGKTWSTNMLLKMAKSPKDNPMRAINMILSCDQIEEVDGLYKVRLV